MSSRPRLSTVLPEDARKPELRSDFAFSPDRHFTAIRPGVERPATVSLGARIDDVNHVGVLNLPRDTHLVAEAGRVDRLEQGAARLSTSVLKRILDIIGALAGLSILSPLLFLVAAVIVMESPGSPIFRQRRSGYRGHPFVIYKFRTMRVVEDGPDVVQARREDHRITRIGSLLRRTSIDELPQLLNVLKGEMSLAGPRPHALAHDEYYGGLIADYDMRFKTKPGLTGLAQVSGLRGPTPDVAAMAARVEKDLEYIRGWSIVLDMKILFQTVLIFAFHPAAH